MKELYGRSLEGFSLADTHVHTNRSRDVRGRGLDPEEAVLLAEKLNLQAIAITDHDNIRSSEVAINFAAHERLRVQVVVGMEVSTAEGHLIGIYLNSPVPKDESMAASIKAIHSQGGLAIAAHPFFRRLSSSVKSPTILGIIQSADPDVYFDGFEIYNAGVEWALKIRKSRGTDYNLEAQEFFEKNNNHKLGSSIGSSDGHRMTVGGGLTAFKGDLKEAIKKGETLTVALDINDHFQLLQKAINLFGKERVVMGNISLEVLRKRFTNE